MEDPRFVPFVRDVTLRLANEAGFENANYQRVLLTMLTWWRRKDADVFFPGVKTIAKNTPDCEDTIRRAIRQAVACGLLDEVGRDDKGQPRYRVTPLLQSIISWKKDAGAKPAPANDTAAPTAEPRKTPEPPKQTSADRGYDKTAETADKAEVRLAWQEYFADRKGSETKDVEYAAERLKPGQGASFRYWVVDYVYNDVPKYERDQRSRGVRDYQPRTWKSLVDHIVENKNLEYTGEAEPEPAEDETPEQRAKRERDEYEAARKAWS